MKSITSKNFLFPSRFLSLTSKYPQFWLSSQRVTQITTGMVYFTVIYGIGSVVANCLLELDIFPTYTVCLLDTVDENYDNSLVLAFYVMPSLLMAYTTPIIDLVTFRLMKYWADQSRQIPKGNMTLLTLQKVLTIQTAKTQPYFEVEFWKCPFLFYSSIYYVQEELRNILAGWLCGSVAEI